MQRILLVEDEKIMAKNIVFFLEKEGYSIDVAYDGEAGLEKFKNNRYDLLLLDWTLPKMDGLELCKTIRKTSDMPIMMLTAKEELMDKVIGLEVGADDYITKPFHQRELLARIHALLRRNRQSLSVPSSNIQFDGILLDRDKLSLHYMDRSALLTATEFKLLEIMLKHPENVFTREYLFEHVWGTAVGFSDRTVDVNISRLRKKIADITGQKYFHAVRGMGYKFGGEG